MKHGNEPRSRTPQGSRAGNEAPPPSGVHYFQNTFCDTTRAKAEGGGVTGLKVLHPSVSMENETGDYHQGQIVP